MRIDIRNAVSELVQIRLSDNDAAPVVKPPDNGGVVMRCALVEHSGAGGRSHCCCVVQILYGDGYAVARPSIVAVIKGDGNESLHPVVQLMNSAKDSIP
jgi:hypothetical protein